MRFVYYDDLASGQKAQLGIEVFGVVYDLRAVVDHVPEVAGLAAPPVPADIWEYHGYSADQKQQLKAVVDSLSALEPSLRRDLMRSNTQRLSPVQRPSSIRCFSAFEGHTKTVFERRGLGMSTQWYEMPAFHFGNHNAVYGHGAEVPQPVSFWLDFELQIACVIGQQGINVRAEEADAYIAGYTIMNDWCARDLEMYETRIGLGPAKGRDFAISLGPALVTPDELARYAIGEGAQRRYDLKMEVSVNGRFLNSLRISNARSIYFTMAQMIERASMDVTLYPGDVIASGAVDGGSLLCLGAEETLGRWLMPGDIVDLEVEGLGVLRNVVASPR